MAKDTDYTSASGTWWKAHKLSDGSWAFESEGNIPNAQHVYLNAGTADGSVNLAANTDSATASGTHWAIEDLSDGNIALKSLGSVKNSNYQYLNAGTGDGSVNLAANTDMDTASGTHWEIVTLVPVSTGIPVVNTKLEDFIKNNADEIKAQPDIDVDYCLQQFTSTTFQSQYGVVMGQLVEAGCIHGLELCDANDLSGIYVQLQQNGFDGATLKQIHILIGSMIGSAIGGEVCDGVSACEWLGGKIGAALTCLSVTKEVFQGVQKAVSSLKDAAIQTGQIGQDAINAISDAAKTAEKGVSDAIDEIKSGTENDAVDALKGVTDDVGQGFTDLGNEIANGLTDAGGAVAGVAEQAGGAIADAGGQAVGAVEGVGNDIKNGICGIFGC